MRGILRDNIEDNMVIVWAKPGGILRNKMADKNVIMWAKEGGIMRDNMVIVWAHVGGNTEGQEGHCVGQAWGPNEGQDCRLEGHSVSQS